MTKRTSSHQTKVKFEAAIFDRDGVLIDLDLPRATAHFASLLPISVLELGQRWARWGEQVGFPQTLDEEHIFFQSFWDHLSDELNLSNPVRARLHEINYTDYLMPYPDAHPALTYARSQGLKIGVLSNFGLASLQHSLDVVGLGSLVDVAITASVSRVAKPDPRAYLEIAGDLEVDPSKCLFFDDEANFVEGAFAVGMTAYLVDRYSKWAGRDYPTITDLSVLDTLF
jgi:putative hydrolase of the HAD superfamily